MFENDFWCFEVNLERGLLLLLLLLLVLTFEATMFKVALRKVNQGGLANNSNQIIPI
jgi:hypothetical protein